tara:strand:- start:64 stop:1107 length:1044 start_codon:yes stop_codon:yes gene_type:complete
MRPFDEVWTLLKGADFADPGVDLSNAKGYLGNRDQEGEWQPWYADLMEQRAMEDIYGQLESQDVRSQEEEADEIEVQQHTAPARPRPYSGRFGVSAPRSDEPPNPFQKAHMRPFDAAWNLLKALPEHSIREAQSYSDEFERNQKFATANPIIDRLIRDRDEAEYRARVDREGRSLAERPSNYGLEGELPEWANPHVQQRDYGPDAGVPYTPPLMHSAEKLHRLQSTHGEPAGYSHFGPTGTMGMGSRMTLDESRAANAARGVERGDQWSGDYVVNAPGQDYYGSKPRRTGENRAFTNFPYGSRAGRHLGPMNVEPDSPMAQMHNMAPQLEQLPEGLQPGWMDEFRGQ